MSRETLEYLNANTLIGFTAKRGQAWHYRESLQADEPNHYPGAIPVEDVRRRLFGWEPVEAMSAAIVMTVDGVQTIVDETRKQIVHPDSGQVLGVFKSGYQVHGYDEWLVRNVEAILDDDDLRIGSAGLLRGGAQGWVQIETEATQSVEGVEHRPFLTAATSMDGSIATTYGVGTQVVVCDNTLSVALGSFASSVKVRHSSKSLGRLGDVRDALQLVIGAGDAFGAQVRELIAQPVSESRFERFLTAWTASPTDSKRAQTLAEGKRDALRGLWRLDGRVAPWRGTAWGVVAAVNTYTQHEAPIRGADRVTRNAEFMVHGRYNTLDAGTLELLATV